MRTHFMKAVCFGVVLGLTLCGELRAAFVEQINGDAQPATPTARVDFSNDFAGIGWYYTPQKTYLLTGIYSTFRALEGTPSAREVTVQIQSERPINGGYVLAEATFPADQSEGGDLGASFSAISIAAGETYFVNFLNIAGMGVNLGTWEGSPGSEHGILGAVTNLGAYYKNENNGFGTEITNSWEIATNDDGVQVPVSGTHPILRFEGFIVPEPGGWELLVGIAIGSGCYVMRRKRLVAR